MKHINVGCGHNKMVGALNVDNWGEPDYKWDLSDIPWPWPDDEFDFVTAHHVMEHLPDWWSAFRECVRICKPGGQVEIRVPHPSGDSAMTYRDHLHVIGLHSFDATEIGPRGTANAWFENEEKVPVTLESYNLVAYERYQWMPDWLLSFLADHMRNFIWEQRFMFRKIGEAK